MFPTWISFDVAHHYIIVSFQQKYLWVKYYLKELTETSDAVPHFFSPEFSTFATIQIVLVATQEAKKSLIVE